MNITINQNIDEAYYKEFYTQWLLYKSKYQKYETKVGIFFIILAVIVFVLNFRFHYICAGVFMGFGLGAIIEPYLQKRKWLKERYSSKICDSSFSFVFRDETVEFVSLLSNSKIQWGLFQDIIKTKEGVILILENRTMIYIQNKNIKSYEDIDKIVQKIKNC